jgi:hypothetical protein
MRTFRVLLFFVFVSFFSCFHLILPISAVSCPPPTSTAGWISGNTGTPSQPCGLNPTQGCFIDCFSTTACRAQTLVCPPGVDCYVSCGGATESCQGTTVDCTVSVERRPSLLSSPLLSSPLISLHFLLFLFSLGVIELLCELSFTTWYSRPCLSFDQR